MTHENAERLVYAMDHHFDRMTGGIQSKIDTARWVLEQTCEGLDGLGVIVKGNTLFRLLGASALIELNQAGCRIFGDYKLYDVQSTCENDASWLRTVPGLHVLTVHEGVHPKVVDMLARELSNTIVAPVNPLTDLDDEVFKQRGEGDRQQATTAFFNRVEKLNSSGLICSPRDIDWMSEDLRHKVIKITPAIRPEWTQKAGDTNTVNALTPGAAIEAGADILVVGSPLRHEIRQAADMRQNAIRVLNEINEAVT